MTLTELLVSVSLMGIIAVALSAAITVTYRQMSSTEGRINVARSEQSVGTWLPADLASTDISRGELAPGVLPLSTNPAASPCGNCAGIDMSGTNALQLAWASTVSTGSGGLAQVITQVQYQYIQIGGEWQLRRIECVGSSPCFAITVMHDVLAPRGPEAPSDGFVHKMERPTWVLDTPPLETYEGLTLTGNAQRIYVTIHGGGTSEGGGGGQNSINLTAGGVVTEDINPDEFTAPEFIRATTRCGGPIAIMIDDSNSIGTAAMATVRSSVNDFLDAFSGTPTQVQLIRFGTTAYVLGNGTDGNGYYDMSEPTQVDAAKAQVTPSNLSGSSGSAGGTNWHHAFYRALVNDNMPGSQVTPRTLVFFTDGIPTYYFNESGYTGGTNPSIQGSGSSFTKAGFNAADNIAAPHRASIVGVGVGSALTDGQNWNPGTKTGRQILAQVVAGDDHAVPYIGNNAEEASLYLLDGFTGLSDALRTVALKDCGGTLTLQTRAGGAPVNREFVYENTAYWDDDGDLVSNNPRKVTTSANFRTGTFDYEIGSDSDFFTTRISIQSLQHLSGFAPDLTVSPDKRGWTCRAGATNLTSQIVVTPIGSSHWGSITVPVRSNQAVSCILNVVEP